MSKVDLESKVNVLFGEINFLKYLFETVSSVLARNISLSSRVTRGMGGWRGRPATQHDPLGTPLLSHLNSVGLGTASPPPVLGFLGVGARGGRQRESRGRRRGSSP